MSGYAYAQAALFIGACGVVGAILGLIIGMIRKDGRGGT